MKQLTMEQTEDGYILKVGGKTISPEHFKSKQADGETLRMYGITVDEYIVIRLDLMRMGRLR